jgi:hypothetical protein
LKIVLENTLKMLENQLFASKEEVDLAKGIKR